MESEIEAKFEMTIPRAKTIKKSRAWIGAQITIIK